MKICARLETRALAAFLNLSFFAGVARAMAQTQSMCNTGVCVLTWQQDTGTDIGSGYAYRTGQNLSEATITYSSIVTDNFGQLCSVSLDGQVYAQPLIVKHVNWQNQVPPVYYDIAYVVTENDTVYAIDGTNCSILNPGGTSLLNGNPVSGNPTMSAVDCHKIGAMSKYCRTVNPIVGILGTPVIQITSGGTAGTLYVVAETQSVSGGVYTFYHFLHALDITTLAEGVGNEKFGAPVQICSNQCGSYASATAFSLAHIQRPGLLYVPKSKIGNGTGDDYIYVAFSMMDGTTPPNFPNGALIGYDATSLNDSPNSGRLYFQTSAGGVAGSNGGGIWMSGAAPAFGPDGTSNWIFLTTANGTWDASSNPPMWGDSFLKLSPATLLVASTNGYFTPADQWYRSSWINSVDPSCPAVLTGQYPHPAGGDHDLGVGGVTLIPDGELTNWEYLAVNGEKEGGIWFYKRDIPGGHNPACDPPSGGGGMNPCNCPQNQFSDPNVQTYWGPGGQYSGKPFRGGMAFWEKERPSPGQSYIYTAPYSRALTQYPLCDGISATGPIDTTHCSNSIVSTSATFGTGVTPAVSAANSTATDAIVWAIWATGDDQSTLPTSPGVLYAFDADNVSASPLYSSTTCPNRDRIAPGTKFSVPTVANGYVYVGAEQCTWSSSTNMCSNDETGTFYIFTSLSNTIPCS